MKLGFVSTILADQTLDEVLDFAATEGFSCVELMCWPPGRAERRYAGVTHVDVTDLGDAEADEILRKVSERNLSISSLGYYPNPLSADREEAEVSIAHLGRVIEISARLGVQGIPTMVLFRGGVEVSRQVGAMPGERIQAWIDASLAAPSR